MACINLKPFYLSHAKEGVNFVTTNGDGYSMSLDWTRAYSPSIQFLVGYNIYYSTLITNVFEEGVKLVTFEPISSITISEFTPGDIYYFGVRAFLYSPDWYNPNLLPDIFLNTKIYPEAVLTQNLSLTDNEIFITDIEEFPSIGVIKIGHELIRYNNKNIISNSLLISERGFLSTNITFHNLDGYDGYEIENPIITFFSGLEEYNTTIHQSTSKFVYPNYSRTNLDGYKNIIKDIINTDLSADETLQTNFQSYDYVGWHRTDPVSLFNGDCIGTYIGGEHFCADGYEVGFQIRGLPFNEANDQRQEVLLELEGDPCVLLKRRTTGIVCACVEANNQNPNLRCTLGCYGTGFVGGYEQYYNPRRSDGRILVKFGPTDEDIKIEDEGLEGYFQPNCWTLTIPVLKSRDVLIRFNVDGSEEFRYKILKVTRNRLIASISGAQKFDAVRVRRTDPIYQSRSIRDTSTIPQTISTGIGMVNGPGGILPHLHSVKINERIINISQINETTSFNQGHAHAIINGIVQPVLGHTHTLLLSP